jgi:tetratricopeptide (TPR) repeat protein
LWDDGALAPATAQYRMVVADDPQNAEALRNLARLASIDGRQHQAKQMASSFLAAHPKDVDSRLTLAQAEYWMGRPDSADNQLQLVLNQEPKNGDALSMRSDIHASQAPEFRTKFDIAKQSDDILVQGTHFEGESSLSDGRSSLGFYFDHYRYTAQNETGELLVNRPAIYGRYRMNDWMELAGELSSDRITSPQDSSFNQTIGTYDADLSIWANDTTRFNLRSQRETLDNVVSLGLGIAEQINSLSMEIRPDRLTRAYVSVGRAAYNDGNRANIEQAEYERQVGARPRVYLGVRTYAANYQQQLDNGYFSPNSFRALEATGRLESRGDRLWGYDIHGSYGREWASGAMGDTASVLGATVRYRLSRATQLELFYDAANTVQASNSGSFRHSGGIALRERL